MSRVVGRLSCPRCGSRDNVAQYDDGGQHCFTPGCGYHLSSSFTMPTNEVQASQEIDPILGSYKAIPSRKIPEETCRSFGYFQGVYGDSKAYYWPIYDKERRLTGYKIRKPKKQFVQHGSNPDNTFLGQEKWSGGGKLLVVFEGEYDCLAYAAVRKTWPCVSLPNGADSADKCIRSNLDWLLKFEEVILCFDGDDHGQKAAQKAVQLLPPRRGKIGTIQGYKDANEALVAGDSKAIMTMVWSATEYEPDGIISGSKLLEMVLEDPKVESAEYPYSFLNSKLHGLRKGELVTITAGTGIGKSTFVAETAYDLLVRQKETVGYVALELLAVLLVWSLITLSTLIAASTPMSKSQPLLKQLLERAGFSFTTILALLTLPFCLTVYVIWLLVAGATGSCLITCRFLSQVLTKVTNEGPSIKR